MADPWIDSVKNSRQLTVYAGSSCKGTWATVVKEAIREFNALSKGHHLGVTLVKSTSSGGANVEVETLNGQHSVTYGGTKGLVSVDGAKLHGRTLLFSTQGKNEKAYVFLPSQPKVLTPQDTYRTVGSNVMKIIAVHEFVHACGLLDADHTTELDVFHGSPSVAPGDTAEGDRVSIQPLQQRKGKLPKVMPIVFMPPIVMSGATAGRIKALWK